jgi:hypothetical protein
MALAWSLAPLVRKTLGKQRKLRKERLISQVSWRKERSRFINRIADKKKSDKIENLNKFTYFSN